MSTNSELEERLQEFEKRVLNIELILSIIKMQMSDG